jgi:hypothetical protein
MATLYVSRRPNPRITNISVLVKGNGRNRRIGLVEFVGNDYNGDSLISEVKDDLLEYCQYLIYQGKVDLEVTLEGVNYLLKSYIPSKITVN